MRITEKDVQNAVDTLNTMLPQHEVIFGHRYNYYALDYRPKGTDIISDTIFSGTKRECYKVVWAMMTAIRLAGGNNEKD